MTKLDFVLALNDKLSGLPSAEVEERISFYIEMIEDRIDDGLAEEDAVAAVGSVDAIAAQILSDIPLSVIAKERIKPKRRLRAWEIVLIALGSPIWLSLAIAAFAVFLSLYAVLWSVIVSLWAIFISFAVSSLGGVVAGIVLAFVGNGLLGVATVGAGLFCGGVAIFLFFACKAATKGTLRLTKRVALGTKKSLAKKEEA